VVVSGERSDLPVVVHDGAPVPPATLRSSLIVPAMIAEAGDRAAKRFLAFFAASIENDNTRLAYYRAVCSFFGWLEQHGIGELPDIEPFHVAAYLKALRVSDAGDPAVKERTASRPTVKQHLAAIRMLFDWLVVGQVLAINRRTRCADPSTSSSAARHRCSARTRRGGCSAASRS
jgi:site-specific recombinase XerD